MLAVRTGACQVNSGENTSFFSLLRLLSITGAYFLHIRRLFVKSDASTQENLHFRRLFSPNLNDRCLTLLRWVVFHIRAENE
jgi:hypothetical protein